VHGPLLPGLAPSAQGTAAAIRDFGQLRPAWASGSRPDRVVTGSECWCRTGVYARSAPPCLAGAA